MASTATRSRSSARRTSIVQLTPGRGERGPGRGYHPGVAEFAPEQSTAASRRRDGQRPRGRARQRAFMVAAVPAGEDDQLAELAELLRTAGVAGGRQPGPAPRPAAPQLLSRHRQARGAEGRARRRRRQPGGLRRRALAPPGAQPGDGARRAGDRPHGDHPRHLRRPRPHRRGQAPGRAGPARVQPGPDARPVVAPRAPRRRDRHPGPGRDPDRDRPPPGPRPDRRAQAPARPTSARPAR